MDSSFGSWVKRRRKALDLTQQELARRIGCSLSLIFKIESDERRPSRQVAELLAGELEIPPEHRDIFLQVARQEKTTDRLADVDRDSPANFGLERQLPRLSLPIPLTTLLGREHELQAITHQLADPGCRLLTLSGPGGAGKTRLALEVARRMEASYEQTACFVPLAGTNEPAFIVPAIAEALGFVFSGTSELKVQLFNFLKEQRLLLVLDNLEHLLDGIELLSDLLEYSPDVKILATSREALSLRAEWIFDVQGLPIPAGIELERLETNSAAALFIQRARQVNVNFEPAENDRSAIQTICRLVEGLPLGLELAASWVNTLSCVEIAAEIERSVDFLATTRRDIPERHRSMNALFDYSWNLLSENEKDVLARLSVFHGGFRRHAAAAVAGASLDHLSALVSKSLIRYSPSDRYDQHELLRQYSAVRLGAASDGGSATRDMHARHYLSAWGESESQLKGPGQREATDELIADIDNFRTAWDLAVVRRHFELLTRSLRSFLIVYDLRGWYANAIRRLEMLIAAVGPVADQMGAKETLGLSLSFLGWFHFRRGDLREARNRFDEGIALLRPVGDALALADVLALSSPVFTSLGEADRALHDVYEAVTQARAAEDQWRISHALMMQGGILAGWGQYRQAYDSSRTALAGFRRLGDLRLTAVTLNTLGFVCIQLSRLEEARTYLHESLRLVSASEDPWSAGTALGNLGIVELQSGNGADAQGMLRESIHRFGDLGMLGDVAYFMNFLGEALWLEGAPEAAEEEWLDAIRIAREIQALPTVLAILVRLAALEADREHFSPAFSWATVVLNHPAAWNDSRSRAQVLRQELASKAPGSDGLLDCERGPEVLDDILDRILARPRDDDENL